MAGHQLYGPQQMSEFRLFGYRISNSSILNDGFQMACGVALAACSWKWNFHPTLTISFSAMAIEGAFHCCTNLRNHYNKLPHVQRVRILSTSTAAAGTVAYFYNIASLSRAFKGNDIAWLDYLGKAGVSYFIAVTAINRYGGSFYNIKPFYKFCEVLFGPALIGSAAYYLLVFQRLYKEWLCCMPLFASTAAANHICIRGHRRLRFLHGFRNSQLAAIKLLVGGGIAFASGSVLFVYSVNHHSHPFISLLFAAIIVNGVIDIECSIEIYQQCIPLPIDVYYFFSRLITGPIFFFSSCLGINSINGPFMLVLVHIIIAGLSFAMILKTLYKLYLLFPPPVFGRYCLRGLGPLALVYGLMASAYTGYRMGWRFSLLTMPLVTAGAYGTYNGWN